MTFFRRRRRERELDAEIEAHLALEEQLRRERGESPADARRSARRDFGNVALVKEVTRGVWRHRLVDVIEQDLRHALRATGRMFRREFGVALMAVLTLAFAIGANALVFSAINALLLKTERVGIGRPQALVDFGRKNSDEFIDFFAYADLQTYRNRQDLFTGVAACGFPQGAGVHVDGGPLEVLQVAPVTGDFFDVMEIKPAAGRLLTVADDRQTAERVGVISNALWHSHFGALPDAVGRRIRIGSRTFAIVGVAPALDGSLLFSPDVWLPLSTHPAAASFKEPNFNLLALTGRVRPGVSIRQAQASIDATQAASGSSAAPIRIAHEIWRDSVSPVIAMMAGASLVLLIIACANMAGLALARASTRRREVALRLALGASRWRLVTQLLTETIAIFGIAGILGACWAPIVANILSTEAGIDVSADARVFAFTLGLTLLAAVASGLTPALHATRTDPGAALKDGGIVSADRRTRLRNALVVCQVALALMLLVGCGLFLQTLRSISQDLGFNPAGVDVVSVDLKAGGMSDIDGETFARDLVQRASAVPGVSAVSLAWGLPLVGGEFTSPILVPGRPASPQAKDGVPVAQDGVMPGFFKAMGTPLLKGRDFTFADRSGPAAGRTALVLDWSADPGGVAVVNQSLADMFWHDEDPIGKRFYTCGSIVETCAIEVVGLVGDTRLGVASGAAHAPVVYRPFTQSYMPQVSIVVRNDQPDRVVPAVRQLVRDVNPEAPILSAQRLDEAIGDKLSMYRLGAAIAGSMGAVGMLLASLGIYGVVAFSVTMRRREIGIRTALGAQSGSVIRLILRDGVQLILMGVVIGGASAAGAARLIASAVAGLSVSDPSAYVLSAVTVAVVACAACYFPARRAAKSDPLIVLRQD